MSQLSKDSLDSGPPRNPHVPCIESAINPPHDIRSTETETLPHTRRTLIVEEATRARVRWAEAVALSFYCRGIRRVNHDSCPCYGPRQLHTCNCLSCALWAGRSHGVKTITGRTSRGATTESDADNGY